jgi:LAO/AO transport system kinase
VRSPSETVEAAVRGDRAALARAISMVESGQPEALSALARLPARRLVAPGAPHVVGVTGPPGAGKSTFVDRLIADAAGRRVAVVAVDPSSPFSGGAILGDRLRMEAHAADTNVYVRSLASRGHIGGVSRATAQVADLLDASGWDLVLVETVGVGQGELQVMEVADSVLVVLTPESGDGVQAMKAGLLEVADVFVVNKADRPGADALVRELEVTVQLDGDPGWRAPVIAASATEGRGVAEVAASLGRHLAWCMGAGRGRWEARRADGRVRTWLQLVSEEAQAAAVTRLRGTPLWDDLRAGRVRPEQVPR